jgi:hypothetical protein
MRVMEPFCLNDFKSYSEYQDPNPNILILILTALECLDLGLIGTVYSYSIIFLSIFWDLLYSFFRCLKFLAMSLAPY